MYFIFWNFFQPNVDQHQQSSHLLAISFRFEIVCSFSLKISVIGDLIFLLLIISLMN